MRETSKPIIEQEFSEDEDDLEIEYVDPAELSPIGDEEMFSTEINAMVAENAPRLFALCEEIGERVDAGIIAWGISFDDYTEVMYRPGSATRRTTFFCSSPERAYELFTKRLKVHNKIRLVWVRETQEQAKVA